MSWQPGGMRPTAYRRNARGLRDRQAFERSACRPARCLPPAAPKPRSPTSSASPARTSAAGMPAGTRAGWRRWQRRPDRAGPRACPTPTPRPGPGAAPGRPRPWLRHRPLDPCPHHHRDRAAHRDPLPSRARLEAAAPPAGLAAAAPRPPRHRARRAGHRPLGGEDWPRIRQNARRRSAVIVFWDESGASLLPVTRRTWAPRGHTPVIRHRFKWKRVRWLPRCATAPAAAAPHWPSTTRLAPTTPTP